MNRRSAALAAGGRLLRAEREQQLPPAGPLPTASPEQIGREIRRLDGADDFVDGPSSLGVSGIAVAAAISRAMGPRAGQKVFTLQTVPAQPEEEARKGVAQYAGFSLHAGTSVEAEQTGKLERLVRYVSRPAIAEDRLALTERGEVCLQLKTPYRDGSTHVILEPLDFLARLAALVPPPRVHQTRYHGVFAPHHALRAAITPAGRGRGARHEQHAERPVPKHASMTWAQRLKRVFAIEIETCRRCGGKLKVIASIEDPVLIERILAHRRQRPEAEQPCSPFASRAPPSPSPLC